MKRLFLLALAIVMSLNIFMLPASAAENTNPVVQVIVGGDDMNDNARASNPPTKHHNLSSADYIATLDELAASKGSYTICYFTTATETINLECNLLRSGTTQNLNRELEIKLYEKYANGTSYHLLDLKTVNFTTDVTKTVTFDDLGSNNFYYIRFVNKSSEDPADNLDISGTITISD